MECLRHCLEQDSRTPVLSRVVSELRGARPLAETVERRLAAILAADMVGYSRLMELDEAGTLKRQRRHRTELIDPLIEKYHGRIVKTTGDGLLVEFVSVLDAVRCAISIQTAMRDREARSSQSERIDYRIGINLGDVVVEGGDLFGEGVNVAARLEALSEAGGIAISDAVYRSVEHKVDDPFELMGERTVKNISRPVKVWQWRLGGSATADIKHKPGWKPEDQVIRFCVADDGVRIAYATVGEGPPLVKAPNWMTHLEYDWKSPAWRHLMQQLSQDRTLIRFDQRGTGLSDREVENISFDLFVKDLETVIKTIGLKRFPLLGISQGAAISLKYAATNPDRVSALVLYGGYARGRRKRGSQEQVEQADAYITMIRHGWGQDNPRFRQLFTSAFMPDATPDEMKWFNELQRVSVSPSVAARIRDANESVDVSPLLPEVEVPTLVLHVRDDGVVPFEEGRRLAALIPNARFVPLEGRNHLMLEDEQAWPRFVEEVTRFLSGLAPSPN